VREVGSVVTLASREVVVKAAAGAEEHGVAACRDTEACRGSAGDEG
jgi:hypothetical protein